MCRYYIDIIYKYYLNDIKQKEIEQELHEIISHLFI